MPTPRVYINGEEGAREAARFMDWGIVIEQTMDGDIEVYLIGQGAANEPPDEHERENAGRLLAASR